MWTEYARTVGGEDVVNCYGCGRATRVEAVVERVVEEGGDQKMEAFCEPCSGRFPEPTAEEYDAVKNQEYQRYVSVARGVTRYISKPRR